MFGLNEQNLYAAMNYNQKIELQTHLSNLLDKKIDIFAEDDHYYSLRTTNDNIIKLHRNHIPLNPKVLIKTQQQYNFYIEYVELY